MPPSLQLPSPQDCAAAQSNYTSPSCTGGSPDDAFAFAASTGVATDDGEGGACVGEGRKGVWRYKAARAAPDATTAWHGV